MSHITLKCSFTFHSLILKVSALTELSRKLSLQKMLSNFGDNFRYISHNIKTGKLFNFASTLKVNCYHNSSRLVVQLFQKGL